MLGMNNLSTEGRNINTAEGTVQNDLLCKKDRLE